MYAIVINTQFSALHSWPECPIVTAQYLKTPHRHMFHVQMKKKVHHDDRDIEFITFKELVNSFLREHWENKDLGTMSCEQMAYVLGKNYDCFYVQVMEDNENGSEYYQDK